MLRYRSSGWHNLLEGALERRARFVRFQFPRFLNEPLGLFRLFLAHSDLPISRLIGQTLANDAADGFDGPLEILERAIKATEDAAYGATFFIMASNFKTNELTVQGYTRQQLGLALNDLKEFEETNRSSVNYDVVLVSVASLAELRRAYPNYYADTNLFLRLLRGYLDPYRARRNA